MVDPSDFYLKQDEPDKSCLLALRSIILDFDKRLNETTKFGMPCFCFKNKALCYLWTDKKTNEPYILFVDGQLMDHPMLEAGERAKMKIFRVDPNKDLPVEVIKNLLTDSMNLR